MPAKFGGSKMLGILPQFDAANAIRTIVLTDPKAGITQGIPDAPSAKSAKREITSASLIMRTHLSSV